MPFCSNLSVSSFLSVTDLRFFATCHLTILTRLLLHFANMSLLAFQLPGFLPGEVTLMNSLMNALVLTDLGFTDCRRANLCSSRGEKSESEQEEKNVSDFHGYLFLYFFDHLIGLSLTDN